MALTQRDSATRILRAEEQRHQRHHSSFHRHLPALGFHSAIQVTEENTRYRGWLVRRLCYFLAILDWKVHSDTPTDLRERIFCSERVQDVLSRRAQGDGSVRSRSPAQWRREVLSILGQIQAPLSRFLLRLCSWALLRLLNRMFLNLLLHGGQLQMVRRAAQTPDVPLVFLSTHKSPLDRLLLPFLLFSQGLGVPRVASEYQTCTASLRALLSRLGGVFLPPGVEHAPDSEGGALSRAVLASYVEELLRSRQHLLIFLEEPFSGVARLSAPGGQWLALVLGAVRAGAVPDVRLVPVGIAYDVAPAAPRGGLAGPAQPSGLWSCLLAARRALGRSFGCVRVDLAQPFSLQAWEPLALAWLPGDGPGRQPLTGSCSVIPGVRRKQPLQAERLAQVPGGAAAARRARQKPRPAGLGEGRGAAPGPGRSRGAASRRARPGGQAQPARPERWRLLLCHHGRGDHVHALAAQAPRGCLPVPAHVRLLLAGGGDAAAEPGRGFLGAAAGPGAPRPGPAAGLHLPAPPLARGRPGGPPAHGGGGEGAEPAQRRPAARLHVRGPGGLRHQGPAGGAAALPGAGPAAGGRGAEPAGAALQDPGARPAAAPRRPPAPALPVGLVLQPGRAGQADPVRAAGGRGGPGRVAGLRLCPETLLAAAAVEGDGGFQRQRQRLRRGRRQALLQAHAGAGLAPSLERGRLFRTEPSSLHFARGRAPENGALPTCLVCLGGQTPAPQHHLLVSQLDNCPDFLLLLCSLPGPLLKTYERAAAFLLQSGCPEPELEYVEKLQRFLVQKAREDGSFECANRNLALSSVRTFKELGVLREQPGPAGSILHLSETFSTPANCQRLEKFIWQFT